MGLDPICLDWREICDGKTDCMNNNVDEPDCYELEMNICSEDEFQCRNGQCVPIIFFRTTLIIQIVWMGPMNTVDLYAQMIRL